MGIGKSFMARCCNRPNLKSRRIKSRKNISSTTTTTTTQICTREAGFTAEIADDLLSGEVGFTVDIADLLFTPERDFLVKNNGHKVMVDDLKGKAIVLFIVPLYEGHLEPRDNLDMIQAYNELSPLGGVEFVFVPVYIDHVTDFYNDSRIRDHFPNIYNNAMDAEAVFNHLFSTLPFPAVPFSDTESCGDRVVKTFSVDDANKTWCALPYWVIIDHTSTVVMQRWMSPYLFKLYGGAELHPLSSQSIGSLEAERCAGPDGTGNRCEARKRLINKWDQLLASPTRDFLLSSNGDQVPISSLKGKVIGLYFCDNVPHPRLVRQVKKVYDQAKLRGYDFEIVQINFHYHFFNSSVSGTQDMSIQQCKEDISWLMLPFKDPSCKKLQRIFRCDTDIEDYWLGDCLVIVDPRQAEVLYEFSGLEIFGVYGIEGYPFTRQSLYEIETRRQKKEAKLQLLFPPEECHFGSQLAGKRVLVLFGEQRYCESSAFVSMLKSKYLHQVYNEEEDDDEFEVVFVSTDKDESRFNECIKDMPWLVHPYSEHFGPRWRSRIFRRCGEFAGAAFGIDGELIAKHCALEYWRKEDESPFPFFLSADLATAIRHEVDFVCELDKYHLDEDDES